MASDKISEPLAFILNETIKKGVIPQKLKMTVVYPIHKKEPKMKVSNYRPISILPLVNKIYEKLTHERLMDFLISMTLFININLVFRGKSLLNMEFVTCYIT